MNRFQKIHKSHQKIFLHNSKTNYYIKNKVRDEFKKLERSKKIIFNKIDLNKKKF